MNWKELERPGFFGDKKDQIIDGYNQKYGKENWQLAWKFGQERISFLLACQIYEDAYFADSLNREDLWKKLTHDAKNIYDHKESNIFSGFDYSIQESPASHLQDIAIRRVVLRRSWQFEGDKLIQIRSHKEYWGRNLSPGKVQFHLPALIEKPNLEGWWEKNSVEDFYQSNKYLFVKIE